MIVKRNGNYFTVKKDNDSHYYIALLIGKARITAWKRISKKKLNMYYKIIENYENEVLKYED